MKFKYLLPVILWSLIILWLISIPGSNMPKTPLLAIPHLDKLVHFGIFVVFAFLLNYGLSKQASVFCQKQQYTISLLIGVIYSAGTELLQYIVISARSAEFWDFVANFTGCVVGVLVFKYGRRLLPAFIYD